MTHADSGLALLGRSRDTGSSVLRCPSPLTTPFPIQRVTLHIWGLTRKDADDGHDDAGRAPGSGLWDVADLVEDVGPSCPIPRGDARALGQGADYGHAWAVYPVVDAGRADA